MRGKYGPHGELFFFLFQKEPATVPVSETFSPFINADIRTPFSSADVLKKCALTRPTRNCGRRKRRVMDGIASLLLGDEWKMGFRKSPMWESEGEAW